MKKHEGIIAINSFIELYNKSDIVIIENGKPMYSGEIEEDDTYFHAEEETEEGLYEFDLDISPENVDFFIEYGEDHSFIVGDGNDKFSIKFIRSEYLTL